MNIAIDPHNAKLKEVKRDYKQRLTANKMFQYENIEQQKKKMKLMHIFTKKKHTFIAIIFILREDTKEAFRQANIIDWRQCVDTRQSLKTMRRKT